MAKKILFALREKLTAPNGTPLPATPCTSATGCNLPRTTTARGIRLRSYKELRQIPILPGEQTPTKKVSRDVVALTQRLPLEWRRSKR
jgi:hypothetical protein